MNRLKNPSSMVLLTAVVSFGIADLPAQVIEHEVLEDGAHLVYVVNDTDEVILASEVCFEPANHIPSCLSGWFDQIEPGERKRFPMPRASHIKRNPDQLVPIGPLRFGALVTQTRSEFMAPENYDRVKEIYEELELILADPARAELPTAENESGKVALARKNYRKGNTPPLRHVQAVLSILRNLTPTFSDPSAYPDGYGRQPSDTKGRDGAVSAKTRDLSSKNAGVTRKNLLVSCGAWGWHGFKEFDPNCSQTWYADSAVGGTADLSLSGVCFNDPTTTLVMSTSVETECPYHEAITDVDVRNEEIHGSERIKKVTSQFPDPYATNPGEDEDWYVSCDEGFVSENSMGTEVQCPAFPYP